MQPSRTVCVRRVVSDRSLARLSLRLPWPLTTIDPHRLDDAAAAFFGEALFDTLYARDETGQIVPALAESEPEPDGNLLRVKLRSGLRTARGRPLGTKDVVSAIARARSLGARGWLADVPVHELLPGRIGRPRVDEPLVGDTSADGQRRGLGRQP